MGAAAAFGVSGIVALAVLATVKLKEKRAQKAFVRYQNDSWQIGEDSLKASVAQP